MKNSVKIFTLILLLSPCISDGKNIENPDEHTNDRVDTEKPINEFQPYRSTSHYVESNGTQKIQYSDLTIVLEEIEMGWDDMYLTDNDSIYVTDKDTAYFDLWPGDWFFDKKFNIEQSEFDKIELYEKIIYKMAMRSNRTIEVPFCVINNWKTFESEWSPIQLNQNELKFRSNEEDINPIINFTVEELKAAVKEHCGIEWYNEIKNMKSKDQLPSELFTTTYIFKIVARKSKTGDRIQKFIVFNTPTSC
ncbi:hypothetical protein G5B10_00575 [Fluviicola sp. SGL-29]|nr:hypothetical protein [Fluviicola sp. SGL-29]